MFSFVDGVITKEVNEDVKFKLGQWVACPFENGDVKYCGQIVRIHENDRYRVQFLDGDYDKDVKKNTIIPFQTYLFKSSLNPSINCRLTVCVSDGVNHESFFSWLSGEPIRNEERILSFRIDFDKAVYISHCNFSSNPKGSVQFIHEPTNRDKRNIITPFNIEKTIVFKDSAIERKITSIQFLEIERDNSLFAVFGSDNKKKDQKRLDSFETKTTPAFSITSPFKDVTFILKNNVSVEAHRLVLASLPYFEKLLSDGEKTYYIPHIHSPNFIFIIDKIYSQDFSELPLENQFSQIYDYASRISFTPLCLTLQHHIRYSITIHDQADILFEPEKNHRHFVICAVVQFGLQLDHILGVESISLHDVHPKLLQAIFYVYRNNNQNTSSKKRPAEVDFLTDVFVDDCVFNCLDLSSESIVGDESNSLNREESPAKRRKT